MDTLISCTIILPDLLSGHQVVVWVIDLLQPPATCITVAHQKTQDIDVYAFQKDICCVFYKESVDDLDNVITTSDNTLHLLLDKYAPQQTLRPHAPWSSEYLQNMLKGAMKENFNSLRHQLTCKFTIKPAAIIITCLRSLEGEI